MKETVQKKLIGLLIDYRVKSDVLGTEVWWIGVQSKIGARTIARIQARKAYMTYLGFHLYFMDRFDKRTSNISRGVIRFSNIEDVDFYIGGAVALLFELKDELEPLAKIDKREVTDEMYNLTRNTVAVIRDLTGLDL